MITLEDTKVSGLDSRWTNDAEDKDKFKKQLTSQTIIWKQFIKILKEMYRNIHAFEYDFDAPTSDRRTAYAEGYKKALSDVYKLIPTQRETNPS